MRGGIDGPVVTAGELLLALPYRRPTLVLILTAAITIAISGGLPRLGIDASIEAMIVSGDPEHAAFEEKKAIFGSDEVVAVAVPFTDALSPESLSIQRRIADRIEGLDCVEEVDSLATTDDIFGRDDALVVEPLVPRGVDLAGLDSARLDQIRERVASSRLWPGWLISQDGRTAALQVHLEEVEDPSSSRAAFFEAIEGILREELGERPYYLAGHPYMKSEIARTMRGDHSVFLPVSVSVMALLLLLGVGSVRTAGIMLVSILLAVVWMLGLMGWMGQSFTALSNTAPTILLALGTAYFMHLAASYQKEARGGDNGADVVQRALSHVRRPTVVAGVTTAIGFGSLATSKIPLVEGFGLVIAVGMLAVVVIACFSLPAALTLLSPSPGSGTLAGSERLGLVLFRISRLTATRSGAILLGAAALFACSAVAGSRLKVDSSGPNAFAQDSQFRISSEFYRDHLSGDVIENVYVSAALDDGLKEPGLLRRMLAFQEAAEALPQIDESISIANYVALMNRAMYDNRELEERIPDTRAAVSQYLLLYSLSGDLEEFDDLVDGAYKNGRIILTATVLSSAESAELRETLTRLAQEYFPEEAESVAVLSTEILLSQAADELAREQVRGFGTALVLIILVVALALRSVAAGWLLLLPNGLPIALNFGVMSALGLTLSHSTALIAVVALGIAVDSTVHLLATIRRSERVHGSLSGGVIYALQTTGRPVVLTSLIIVAGFSILSLSGFKVVSEFGGLTALTILYCLGADLLVLPAQLLHRRGRARSSGAGTSAESVTDSEGHPSVAALLTFDGRAVPALLEEESGNKASFRLIGEENTWRGSGESAVTANWLDGDSPAQGHLSGVDDVSTPVLRIEWRKRTRSNKRERNR